MWVTRVEGSNSKTTQMKHVLLSFRLTANRSKLVMGYSGHLRLHVFSIERGNRNRSRISEKQCWTELEPGLSAWEIGIANERIENTSTILGVETFSSAPEKKWGNECFRFYVSSCFLSGFCFFRGGRKMDFAERKREESLARERCCGTLSEWVREREKLGREMCCNEWSTRTRSNENSALE